MGKEVIWKLCLRVPLLISFLTFRTTQACQGHRGKSGLSFSAGNSKPHSAAGDLQNNTLSPTEAVYQSCIPAFLGPFNTGLSFLEVHLIDSLFLGNKSQPANGWQRWVWRPLWDPRGAWNLPPCRGGRLAVLSTAVWLRSSCIGQDWKRWVRKHPLILPFLSVP